MNFLQKISQRAFLECNFFLEQKTGWKKPHSPDTIPKYLIRKYLPANPSMIDCGAHNGADSVQLIKVLGGTIHAFEPVPDIYGRLKRNTRRYRKIYCYNLALGNTNGQQDFYVSEGGSDASSSLLKPQDHLVDHPDVSFNKGIQVTTKTMDQWAIDEKVGRIDLLWLDMQGFELEMLKASPNMLQTVRVIHTEVSVKKTYDGVPLYPEYRDWLEDQGFKVVMEAIPPGWDMGNVLFARKES